MDTATTAVLDELKTARNDRNEAWKAFDDARTKAKDEEGNIPDAAVDDLKKLKDAYDGKSARVLTVEEKLQLTGQSGDKPDSPFEKSDGHEPRQTKSVGQAFVESEQFKRLQHGGYKGAWSEPITVETKTLFDESAGSGGPLNITDYRVGVRPILFQRLTIADLIASGQTNSVSVTYFLESSLTNAAAAVAEAAAKPESAFVETTRTDNVRKIATLAQVTDEMLEDGPAIASYLDGRLRLFVQIAEEAELYGGSGTPPHILGIVGRSGVQTQARSTDAHPDAIYKAITKVRNQFVEPDGIVMHPTDWQTVRLLKDGNQQYYGGGPFTGAYGNTGGLITDRGQVGVVNSLWGLPVVVTTAATAGTALVGAFGTEAQVFRRQGITVDSTNSHSTNFANNITAIRAEERLALAVYLPAAFCTVTGL